SNTTIHNAESHEIGVSRLIEQFKPADPLTKEDIRAMEKFMDDKLDNVYRSAKEHGATRIIGCSGSFETLSDLLAHRNDYYEETIGQSTLNFQSPDFGQLLDELIASSRSEREAMEGMAALRLDIIVLSAITVRLVMRKTGIENVNLSRYSLREGVLFDVLEGKL